MNDFEMEFDATTPVVENGFLALGLSESTLAAVIKKGFTQPSPIQARTIPLLLQNTCDIIGQAQTGTGKTAAFGLPLIELLEESKKKVQALILVPTRELAVQVADEIISFKGDKKLFVTTLYGGQSISLQIKDLRKGVDIVVGTPGRIMDHIEKGTLDLSEISHFILDEADEMLNMGFLDDIEHIFSFTPQQKRVLLFSATMPDRILDIAKNYMGKYEVVAVKKEQLSNDLTKQIYFEVGGRDRMDALVRIIDREPDFYGIVFCQTKIETDDVAAQLVERGYGAEALHGDVSQNQREKILALFKKRKINIVVATDVAARGIDVNNLSHVINYSLPQEAETYVHRIGRTGRAGKTGIAISLVTPKDARKFALIKRIAKAKIERENLPSVTEVIEHKISRLKEKIFSEITTGGLEKYEQIAAGLLLQADPLDVVSALMKMNYQDAFDAKSYAKVRENSGRDRDSRDRDGRDSRDGRDGRRGRRDGGDGRSIRLFLAKGKMDDYSPRKLVDYIQSETNISQRLIDDVKVMEKFSFFTVPYEDGIQMLEFFKAKAPRGRRPMVERAKD